MNQPYQTTSTLDRSIEVDEGARRVLRNTWNLLALTLLFSAGMALFAMQAGWGYPGPIVVLAGYFGLLFLTAKLRNSGWGVLAVFALTGFMGATLGPILNAYASGFGNGSALIAAAFGTTAIAFVGLSAFALVTKKDFGFMAPMLFVGILVAFVCGLIALFFELSALSLAVSGMFSLLMCGLILFQTQQIIRGGERNYIMATVTLFVSIYNLFTSLLHLFGFVFGED